MAITNQQNIPSKQEKSEPWEFKRLLSFGIGKDITKLFVSPFEILLGYLIFIFGISELISNTVSLLFWILIIAILGIVIFERHKDFFLDKPIKKQLKKK